MDTSNKNDISLYLFLKNILDTKYFILFFLILFLSISFFFLDNTDQKETFNISFEINDEIDLTYSQKINSVILTNEEIIDVTKIRKGSINQITDIVKKYLNDVQKTTLIDVSNDKIMTIFFSELEKKNNREKMNITNLNMVVEDVSPLNNFYSSENKIKKLIISVVVPNITKFNEDLRHIDMQVKDKLKLEVDMLISNFEYLKNIKLDKINEKLKESTLKAEYFKKAKLESLNQKVKIAKSLGIIEPSKVDSLKEISNLNERIYDIDIFPRVLNEFLDPQNIKFQYIDSLSEIIFKGATGLDAEIREIQNLSLDQFLYREGMIKDFDIYMEYVQNLEILKTNDAVEKITAIRNNLRFQQNDTLLVKVITDNIVSNKVSLIDRLRIYFISIFIALIVGIFTGFIFNRVKYEEKIYKSLKN